MSRDLQQQRDNNSEMQSAPDVDVDAEHKPEVSRRASNAGLRQVQMKGGAGQQDPEQIRSAAERGVQGPGQALPHFDRIQQSFGRHDISQVKAHYGANATAASRAIGAEAYATGTNIAFAQQPDLHTAAHEAAHVVQQKQGVSVAGGVGSAGDAYEKQADAVADQVVAGKSAEHLLGAPANGAAPGQAVQMKGGDKTVDKTEAHNKSDSASNFGAQSALKHLAVQLHDWGKKVNEIAAAGSQEGSGLEPAAQQIEAIFASAGMQIEMARQAIAADPKGTRNVLASDVKAVQWAWNRFTIGPAVTAKNLLTKASHPEPNISMMEQTVKGFTEQIGFEPADLPLTETKVDGDEKSLAKDMMNDQVTALGAAIESVKAGNDSDASRINIHARYLENVGRDEPAQIKSHRGELKKLHAKVDELMKNNAKLDLGEASNHLAKLMK